MQRPGDWRDRPKEEGSPGELETITNWSEIPTILPLFPTAQCCPVLWPQVPIGVLSKCPGELKDRPQGVEYQNCAKNIEGVSNFVEASSGPCGW